MNKFSALKFGEYLLDKGAITVSQLQEALSVQINSNLLFGELAINAGKMDHEQVINLLSSQQKEEYSGKKVGEIALSLEYLADNERNDILASQSKKKKKIGEILVDQGALTSADCDSYLEEFFSLTSA